MHWISAHFFSLVHRTFVHIILWWKWIVVYCPYLYEVGGGLLIFFSSAVAETSLSEEGKKRWKGRWIWFLVASIVFAGVGIGVRWRDQDESDKLKQQAKEDRDELHDNRLEVSDKMSEMSRTNHENYVQYSSLQSQAILLLKGLVKNNPAQVPDLIDKARVLQQQTDKAQQELLALTMAPQTADQLRDWKGDSEAKQDDLHNREYDEEMRFVSQNPKDTQGTQEIRDRWQAQYDKAEQEYAEKLKAIWAYADFIRKELLLRIPQQYVEDKKDFTSRTREDAAQYLDNLAKRVPPPQNAGAGGAQ